jgi:hypothetical protein
VDRGTFTVIVTAELGPFGGKVEGTKQILIQK